MTSRKNILKILACIGLAPAFTISAAEAAEHSAIIESRPINELWLNAGFYSHHFQKDKGFNNNNMGLGGEYRYSTVASIAAGGFNNSDRQTSHYVGWYWHPLALGSVRFGVAIAGIDGYPKIKNGGWFPSVTPVASLEYKSIGANIVFVPTYKDKLHGALSLQLKVRMY